MKEPARAMRHEPTPAEKAVWTIVRDRRVAGFKFRRQYAIGTFIVDFVCLERTLVLEVDGEIHELQESEDLARQGFLESLGYVVLRFTNAQVLKSAADVEAQIRLNLVRDE